MKLIVLNPGDKAPSGYEHVYVTDKGIDVSNIADNECEEISIMNSFTQVGVEDTVKVLTVLCSKLRLGGKLRLNGVDSRTLARNLISGKMDDAQFNKIVYSCKSLMSIPLLKEITRRSGLKIETLTLDGINYDLTATR